MDNPESEQPSILDSTENKRSTKGSLPVIVPITRIIDVKKQATYLNDQIFHLRGRIKTLKQTKIKNEKRAMKSMDQIKATQIQKAKLKQIKQKQLQRKYKQEKQRQQLCKKTFQFKKSLIKERQRAKESLKMQKLYEAESKRVSKRQAHNIYQEEHDKSLLTNREKVAKVKKEEGEISARIKWMHETMYTKGKSVHNEKVNIYEKKKSKDKKVLKHLKREQEKLIMEAQMSGQKAYNFETYLKQIKFKKEQEQENWQ